MKRLTVFTPTYNRAYILPQLYESLCKQTNNDFDWLIVDDGSTDNTKELINSWINENRINIKYFHQENGGKMRAHNKGVMEANTNLFVCVDSDDYLVDDAVECILALHDTIMSDETISGMIAYKGENRAQPLGTNFPDNVYRIKLYKLHKMGFRGDTTLIYKTKILKQYLFPEIKGEKFITEAYVYNQIDLKFDLIVLSKILIICKYLSDGYSNNLVRVKIENPKGFMKYYDLILQLKLYKGRKNIVNMLEYIFFANIANEKILKNSSRKFLCILCMPLKKYFYNRRMKQYNLNK